MYWDYFLSLIKSTISNKIRRKAILLSGTLPTLEKKNVQVMSIFCTKIRLYTNTCVSS